MSTLKVEDLQNPSNSNNSISLASDSSVALKHSGNQKLVTSATGISITGACTATSFSGDGSALTSLPAQTDATKMPLAGGTFSGAVTFQSAIIETKYEFTDAATITIDPDNSMIQYVLFQSSSVSGGSLARTINVSFDPFQSCLFYFATDGTSGYSITWDSNISWIGGTPPSIHSNGYQFIEFWSESTTKIFGAVVGEAV